MKLVHLLGLTNILFGLAGTVLVVFSMLHRSPIVRSYQLLVFTGTAAINLAFALGLIICGVRLLRKSLSALRWLIWLFIAEIGYFLTNVILFWLVLPSVLPDSEMKFVWRGLESDLAFTPQVLCAYPIIGLLLAIVAIRRMRPSAVEGETHVM